MFEVGDESVDCLGDNAEFHSAKLRTGRVLEVEIFEVDAQIADLGK